MKNKNGNIYNYKNNIDCVPDNKIELMLMNTKIMKSH